MSRCALCHDQIKKIEDDPRLAFDFTPEQLEESAYFHRCHSCLVILEGLRQSQSRNWSFKRDIRRVYATCRGRRGPLEETLHLEIYFVDGRPKQELEYYSLEQNAWKAILPRPTASGHPLSPKALSWVLSSLEQCKSNHTSCLHSHGHSGRPPLPKRVVSLHGDGSANITVRLVEPKRRRGAYIALSHSWGAHQNCITTQASLESRLTNIPWATIPKTFQDVMALTSKLGFRYIWIDSLCIVQDDPIDWETESARMADIYHGAILTIAATSSAGDNEGCCSESTDRFPDMEIALPDDTGACRLAVRQPHRHWTTQTGSGLLKHFPLLTRGWAFQERLLSKRVLHLSESELVWECRQLSICECGGLGQENSPGGICHQALHENEKEKRQHDEEQGKLMARKRTLRLQRKIVSKPPERDAMSPPDYKEIEELQASQSSTAPGRAGSPNQDPIAFMSHTNVPLYEDEGIDHLDHKECPDLVFHFHQIVEEYSKLELTKPTDRLPALSGLCKRVQHLRNNYLAGTWSDSLCYDLLWRVDTINLAAKDNGARPPEYRGPTWSWISIDSPVLYWSDIINFNVNYEGFPVSMTRPNRYESYFHGFRATQYNAAGQRPDKIAMAVTVPGQNPFGTVTSAVLTIEASATTATLQYTYDPHWLGGKGDHDPVRYKLELEHGGQQTAEVLEDGEQPAETVEIPFLADYSLGAAGPSCVPADSQLTLLLIHPKVCLILRHAWRNGSLLEINGEIAWERVGIARISDAMLNYYRIDWMKNSEVKRFHIV